MERTGKEGPPVEEACWGWRIQIRKVFRAVSSPSWLSKRTPKEEKEDLGRMEKKEVSPTEGFDDDPTRPLQKKPLTVHGSSKPIKKSTIPPSHPPEPFSEPPALPTENSGKTVNQSPSLAELSGKKKEQTNSLIADHPPDMFPVLTEKEPITEGHKETLNVVRNPSSGSGNVYRSDVESSTLTDQSVTSSGNTTTFQVSEAVSEQQQVITDAPTDEENTKHVDSSDGEQPAVRPNLSAEPRKKLTESKAVDTGTTMLPEEHSSDSAKTLEYNSSDIRQASMPNTNSEKFINSPGINSEPTLAPEVSSSHLTKWATVDLTDVEQPPINTNPPVKSTSSSGKPGESSTTGLDVSPRLNEPNVITSEETVKPSLDLRSLTERQSTKLSSLLPNIPDPTSVDIQEPLKNPSQVPEDSQIKLAFSSADFGRPTKVMLQPANKEDVSTTPKFESKASIDHTLHPEELMVDGTDNITSSTQNIENPETLLVSSSNIKALSTDGSVPVSETAHQPSNAYDQSGKQNGSYTPVEPTEQSTTNESLLNDMPLMQRTQSEASPTGTKDPSTRPRRTSGELFDVAIKCSGFSMRSSEHSFRQSQLSHEHPEQIYNRTKELIASTDALTWPTEEIQALMDASVLKENLYLNVANPVTTVLPDVQKLYTSDTEKPHTVLSMPPSFPPLDQTAVNSDIQPSRADEYRYSIVSPPRYSYYPESNHQVAWFPPEDVMGIASLNIPSEGFIELPFEARKHASELMENIELKETDDERVNTDIPLHQDNNLDKPITEQHHLQGHEQLHSDLKGETIQIVNEELKPQESVLYYSKMEAEEHEISDDQQIELNTHTDPHIEEAYQNKVTTASEDIEAPLESVDEKEELGWKGNSLKDEKKDDFYSVTETLSQESKMSDTEAAQYRNESSVFASPFLRVEEKREGMYFGPNPLKFI